MRFLLDTNIVSDLVRHPRGKVADRISKMGEDDVCTSIVVAAELRMGPPSEILRGLVRSSKRWGDNFETNRGSRLRLRGYAV